MVCIVTTKQDKTTT